MALRVESEPILAGIPQGYSVASYAQKIRSDPKMVAVSDALNLLESKVAAIHKALSEQAPAITEFFVTDPDTGEVITWIGARTVNGVNYTGLWTTRLWVGADGPDTAPFFVTNDGTVVIGQNGSIEIWDLNGNQRGYIGVESAAPQNIEDVQDNGSGLFRITITGHGYLTGDTVIVEDAGGTPDANGDWVIEVIDDDNFDLVDSTFAGTYTSGGTVYVYYAGILVETIAIGNSFTDYSFRAFADGHLEIINALIRLTSATGEIILDPELPSLIVKSLVNDTQVRIELGALYIESLATPGSFIGWSFLPLTGTLENEDSNIIISMGELSGHGRISVADNTGAGTITLDGSVGDIDISGSLEASAHVAANGYVDGFELRIQGVITIDSTRNADFLTLTLDSPLTIANGGTGDITAAGARTNLDVYSKAEVDALIAALTTSSAGSHDHGGAVAADGAHTHTIS